MKHRSSSRLALCSTPSSQPDNLQTFSRRYSGRAKRLSLRIYPGGRVEVVVPRHISENRILRFVDKNRDWILKALKSQPSNKKNKSIVLPDRLELPAIGTKTIISLRPVNGATKVYYSFANGILTLRGATANKEASIWAVRRWLSRVARAAFRPRLDELAKIIGASYMNMQIRMQRTRWGSRSSSGTISLNLCLLFVDPSVLKYLMIHELCHQYHMDHSTSFWRLVGQFEPDYEILDRRLGFSWQQVPGWIETVY